MGRHQQHGAHGYVVCPQDGCRYKWNWKKHAACWQCGGLLRPVGGQPPPRDAGSWNKSPPAMANF
eukprot:3542603-Pyramimonas_sp.AAC.1